MGRETTWAESRRSGSGGSGRDREKLNTRSGYAAAGRPHGRSHRAADDDHERPELRRSLILGEPALNFLPPFITLVHINLREFPRL